MYFADSGGQWSAHLKKGEAARAACERAGVPIPAGEDPVTHQRFTDGAGRVLGADQVFDEVASASDPATLARTLATAVRARYGK